MKNASSPTRRVIRALGRRLSAARTLNANGAPVGMLDLERITRVQPPISTILSRPSSTVFSSTSTKG
jgi:hypothetical protein